jgi:hypothetical protein
MNPRGRLALFLACVVLGGVAGAAYCQSAVQVLTRDGRRLLADRLDSRGGRMVLYLRGYSAPIELSMADVVCVASPETFERDCINQTPGSSQKNEGLGVLDPPKQ